MGDPCATVKLSEFFSDCYAEQYDIYQRIIKAFIETRPCGTPARTTPTGPITGVVSGVARP